MQRETGGTPFHDVEAAIVWHEARLAVEMMTARPIELIISCVTVDDVVEWRDLEGYHHAGAHGG